MINRRPSAYLVKSFGRRNGIMSLRSEMRSSGSSWRRRAIGNGSKTSSSSGRLPGPTVATARNALTEAGQELATLVSALGTWGPALAGAQADKRGPRFGDRYWSICGGESALLPCLRSPSWCGSRFVATTCAPCCSRPPKLHFVIITRAFPSRCACGDRWPPWSPGGAAT